MNESIIQIEDFGSLMYLPASVYRCAPVLIANVGGKQDEQMACVSVEQTWISASDLFCSILFFVC